MSSFIRNKTLNGHALTKGERSALIMQLCEEHNFNFESLLQWLESLSKESFWNAPIADKELNYSPAQALYLTEIYRARFGHAYAAELRALAELMWESRGDAAPVQEFGVGFTPAMDAALMMLCEHVPHYEVLYAFDQPAFRPGPTSADDVAMHVDLIGQRSYNDPLAMQFALEWLSFHLPYYANPYRAGKAQALQASRATSAGDSDSTMWGMEPGAGQ